MTGFAPDPRSIAAALRNGETIADDQFDRLYPTEVRAMSTVHWTPVAVAVAAARLLAPEPGIRVLDAGAGVGKACVIGALTTAASWLGVERRGDRCLVARRVAAALRVTARARFVVGDFIGQDWSVFDAVYLYNPLGTRVGELETFRARRAAKEVWLEHLRAKLATTRPGARVVTYHGIGGAMPPELIPICVEPVGGDELVLWQRAGRPAAPDHGPAQAGAARLVAPSGAEPGARR